MKNKQMYQPSDFAKVAKFGRVETTSDSINHQPIKKFVPKFTQHYAPIRRGFGITVQLQGTAYEDTISIVIQHNPKVLDTLLVQLDGETYKIINISPDERNKTIKYDNLTLKKTDKAGGGNGR